MSHNRPASAKIIQHAEGLGAPDPEQVRHRAEELARIDGRTAYNDEDWREAKRELHGGHAPHDSDESFQVEALVSGHDMVAGSLGHHAEKFGLDGDSLGEELVAEGMDEAEHERMLMARAEVEPREEDEEE